MRRAVVHTVLLPVEWVLLVLLACAGASQEVAAILATPARRAVAETLSASSVRGATHRALIELKRASSGDFEAEGHEDGHHQR
jgi:hypothetical protein